jgi:hypothetical protein
MTRNVAVPGNAELWRAYLRWRAAAGPLADFVQVEPFLSPVVSDQPCRIGRASSRTVRRLRSLLDTSWRETDRPLVLLDAPARLALGAGIGLCHLGWMVVPMIARWPVDGAVLPVTPLTAWLLGGADAAQTASAASGSRARPVCLLLDAGRDRKVSARTLRRRFDNRYAYDAYALPPVERLRDLNVGRALYIGPAAGIAPDLAAYADALATAGIILDVTSLRTMSGPAQEQGPRSK